MKSDELDDIDKLRRAYSDLRDRLIAERDREHDRIVAAQKVLRRVEKELLDLEREQRQLEGGR